jgi:hypothetical protein
MFLLTPVSFLSKRRSPMPKSTLTCAVIAALAMPLATNAAPLRHQKVGIAAGWQASRVIK